MPAAALPVTHIHFHMQALNTTAKHTHTHTQDTSHVSQHTTRVDPIHLREVKVERTGSWEDAKEAILGADQPHPQKARFWLCKHIFDLPSAYVVFNADTLSLLGGGELVLIDYQVSVWSVPVCGCVQVCARVSHRSSPGQTCFHALPDGREHN